MTLTVGRLRCEHLVNPLGMDAVPPRLSWQVSSDRQGCRQAGYQVLVASRLDLLADGTGDLWDSGRVEAGDSVLVPYAGAPLGSRQQAHWSVRVWDELDQVSSYAPESSWEMGLLNPADWQAEWIGPQPPHEPSGVVYLHRTFTLEREPTTARAYVTALGNYELRVKGVRAGDVYFTPGWTDYPQRLQYHVFDLTGLLRAGNNELTAVLVDGWYAGRIGWLGESNHYGTEPQLLGQLEVDGQVMAATDGEWTSSDGPLRSSCLLAGESYDATWTAGPRTPVRLTGGTAAQRVCSPAPAVRVVTELVPLSVTRTGVDSHVVDLGQNISGWLRLALTGTAGTTVRVGHAEILAADGTLYVDNLRSAEATDRYVLSGEPASYQPSLTFHGFRYAEVSGYPDDLGTGDVLGVVLGTDLEPTGEFACSDERVNQLHSNIVWGARGNFLEVPTDCPQRDERMGWMGDAQVFAPTANYLFDTAAFFTKWLRDVTDAQSPEGSFTDVAPLVVLGPDGSAGWADAGVLVSWAVSQWFGDERLLAELYPAMLRWVGYVHAANPALLWSERRSHDNGDWLNVDADTDKTLLATAFFALCARTTAQAAAVLGRDGEARQLDDLADGIRKAFRAEFLLPDGRLTSPTQTAYAMSLRFGLIPEELRAAAVDHLVADIEAHGGYLTCGFLGVPHLLPALSDAGRHDVAYRLLLNEGYPSWLHSVQAGATTIWERWDGWTATRGFQDPAMNSFNHYAFGAVGEWLYRTVAGIDLASPGGRELLLAPCPDASLDWARGRWLSPRGPVACGWTWQSDGTVTVDVEVPVGATATLRRPASFAGPDLQLSSGQHSFTFTTSTQGSRHVRS